MSKKAQKNVNCNKQYKAKKFRVAKEGATTDGRKISREWLEQMAASYDPKTYGARINLEHIKGLHPESAFKAYGDVLALSTEEENGTLYLLAEINPTDDMVEMNRKRQKVYTSIEVDLDFSDSGEAYLVGLALTDSPASLGTEMLEFSASAEVHPYADRKLKPENLFTAAVLTAFEFTEATESDDGLVAMVKSLFTKQDENQEKDQQAFSGEVSEALEEFAKSVERNFVSKETYSALEAKLEKLSGEHTDFVQKMNSTPSTPPRTQATGGDKEHVTDC